MTQDDIIRHPIVAAALERRGMDCDAAIAARRGDRDRTRHATCIPERPDDRHPTIELSDGKAVVGWPGASISVEPRWGGDGGLGGTVFLKDDAVPLAVIHACIGRPLSSVVDVPGAGDVRITGAEARSGLQVLRYG